MLVLGAADMLRDMQADVQVMQEGHAAHIEELIAALENRDSAMGTLAIQYESHLDLGHASACEWHESGWMCVSEGVATMCALTGCGDQPGTIELAQWDGSVLQQRQGQCGWDALNSALYSPQSRLQDARRSASVSGSLLSRIHTPFNLGFGFAWQRWAAILAHARNVMDVGRDVIAGCDCMVLIYEGDDNEPSVEYRIPCRVSIDNKRTLLALRVEVLGSRGDLTASEVEGLRRTGGTLTIKGREYYRRVLCQVDSVSQRSDGVWIPASGTTVLVDGAESHVAMQCRNVPDEPLQAIEDIIVDSINPGPDDVLYDEITGVTKLGANARPEQSIHSVLLSRALYKALGASAAEDVIRRIGGRNISSLPPAARVLALWGAMTAEVEMPPCADSNTIVNDVSRTLENLQAQAKQWSLQLARLEPTAAISNIGVWYVIPPDAAGGHGPNDYMLMRANTDGTCTLLRPPTVVATSRVAEVCSKYGERIFAIQQTKNQASSVLQWIALACGIVGVAWVLARKDQRVCSTRKE